jgi:hypothetical protein
MFHVGDAEGEEVKECDPSAASYPCQSKQKAMSKMCSIVLSLVIASDMVE